MLTIRTLRASQVQVSALQLRRDPASDARVYDPTLVSFDEVWHEVSKDPCDLPHHKVTLASFFRGFSYQLARAGRRTVSDSRDLLPRFRKLIRPNGICLAGRWIITEPSEYTRLFRMGTRALLIARASVAFEHTESGHYRSFGLAGKLFPTLDPQESVRTANFFVIDDNGGTLTDQYVDSELTNRPRLSVNPSSLAHMPLLIAITIAQRLSDMRSETRQLYPLAQARVSDRDLVRTPRYLRVKGRRHARVVARDFRAQLRDQLAKQPRRFDISVTDGKRERWRQLGYLEFQRAVVSDSGDHRLHFSHPRWKAESR